MAKKLTLFFCIHLIHALSTFFKASFGFAREVLRALAKKTVGSFYAYAFPIAKKFSFYFLQKVKASPFNAKRFFDYLCCRLIFILLFSRVC